MESVSVQIKVPELAEDGKTPKQHLVRHELPKLAAGVCETAGQFAYVFALADTEHVGFAAAIISSYCVASVLWSRLFLKEKLSWKHYLCIALAVIGSAIASIRSASTHAVTFLIIFIMILSFLSFLILYTIFKILSILYFPII